MIKSDLRRIRILSTITDTDKIQQYNLRTAGENGFEGESHKTIQEEMIAILHPIRAADRGVCVQFPKALTSLL